MGTWRFSKSARRAMKLPMTPSRYLLLALTLWGLVMIVPDLLRVTQPLGALGFFANSDGLITDVTGPFPDEAASPAWRAGIRVGDRLDLQAMRCTLGELRKCGSTIAVLSGVDYLLPGRTVTLDLAATDGRPARQVTVVGGATSVELSRPRGECPLSDRRHPRRACRRVAGVDAAIGDELGILPLRELVQSRSGLCVPRNSRTMARALARAGDRDGLRAVRRLCGAPALCAARAEQQDRSQVARLRTGVADCRFGLRARATRFLRAACSAIPPRR